MASAARLLLPILPGSENESSPTDRELFACGPSRNRNRATKVSVRCGVIRTRAGELFFGSLRYPVVIQGVQIVGGLGADQNQTPSRGRAPIDRNNPATGNID